MFNDNFTAIFVITLVLVTSWYIMYAIAKFIARDEIKREYREKAILQEPSIVEEQVMEKIRERVRFYNQYRNSGSWSSLYYNEEMCDEYTKEAMPALRKNLKDVGSGYDGQFAFCSFDYSYQKRMGELPYQWNVYFSEGFNDEYNKILKKLLTDGLERIKLEIAVLVDIYLNDYHIKIKKEYVGLKMKEAEFRYKIEKKRSEEREEAKAQKEFERVLKKAEKDEEKAKEKLNQQKEALNKTVSEREKEKLREQIAKLEEMLAQAQEEQRRAISMAQQTRSGYVYVISNVGSFGAGVYKIGMTRRLDPMERVIELGDASVPFPFDVHTFIYSEDAPSLENKLHQRFSNKRVNELNYRKEFFRVELNEIKVALSEFGVDAKFHS